MLKENLIRFVVLGLIMLLTSGCMNKEATTTLVSAGEGNANNTPVPPPATPPADRPERLLNKYMIQAQADAFGMSVDDLNARLAKGERLEDIAQEKGWTRDDMRAKMPEVLDQAISAALKDGAITQQQADDLKKRAPNAGGSGTGGRAPMNEYAIAAMAEVLGMTPTDVQSRISAGENPMDIVREQGLNPDDYRTKFEAAMTKVINQAVSDGKLTQQQADQMLQRMKEQRPPSPGQGPQGGQPGGSQKGPQGAPPPTPQ
jgi:hypothetical protein